MNKADSTHTHTATLIHCKVWGQAWVLRSIWDLTPS